MNYDLILHVDSDDPKVLNLAFNNAANYHTALPGGQFRMVMVANGPAVKLFTMANTDQAARCRELQAMGLDIRVCRNALTTFAVADSSLWEGCTVVPAGVVEIVHLQRQGYAYIKP